MYELHIFIVWVGMFCIDFQKALLEVYIKHMTNFLKVCF